MAELFTAITRMGNFKVPIAAKAIPALAQIADCKISAST